MGWSFDRREDLEAVVRIEFAPEVADRPGSFPLILDRVRIAEEVHATRKLGKSLRGGFALFRLGGNSSLEIQAIGACFPARATPCPGSTPGTSSTTSRRRC